LLFLHMEWSEDRLSPSAFPAALPPDVALQDVIATKPVAPPAPIQTAAASPVVVPMAASDRIGTSVELSPTRGKSVAKAKRSASASAPIRTSSSKTRPFWQVAAAERGSKEVKY
jgi:hypothetical protein